MKSVVVYFKQHSLLIGSFSTSSSFEPRHLFSSLLDHHDYDRYSSANTTAARFQLYLDALEDKGKGHALQRPETVQGRDFCPSKLKTPTLPPHPHHDVLILSQQRHNPLPLLLLPLCPPHHLVPRPPRHRLCRMRKPPHQRPIIPPPPLLSNIHLVFSSHLHSFTDSPLRNNHQPSPAPLSPL